MDPRKLALKGSAVKPSRPKAPRHKDGERFLLGPIPMNWLCTASKVSGRGSGFKVAIALWHLSGLQKRARTVRLSGQVLREMGVERHAVYRGLESLEKARLISVLRHPGRLPVVTILDLEEK